MSKRDYLDQLAHRALYEEYTKPGVGCHMVLKQLLYERPPEHRYYPNEDISLAFGCGAVLALFILIIVITFYP